LIVFKPVEKGLVVVVQDRDTCLAEAHRQLYNMKLYTKV
jgi:hypothetical protein